MSKRFKRVSVLGAGVMGSGIASHLAGAGLDVFLLDIVPPDPTLAAKDKNAFARGGLDKALKSKPASFFTPKDASSVRIGNFDDDLAEAAKADLVIEVVKEDLAIKQQLFRKLEPLLGEHTIVSSNTSGIAIAKMVDSAGEGDPGRSASFRSRFLVTHFFNPVRYMRLLELVVGPDTDKEVLARVAELGERVLGKGIVYGKDTTNFVANRIGVFGMLSLIKDAVAGGYTVEEIDAIFGAPLGRAKSAVFRTADMVGLDTVVHVAKNCFDNLPHDEARDVFQLPEVLQKMVEKGLLGDKSGGGFYKKTKEGLLVLDLNTLEYRPQQKPKFDSLKAAKNIDAATGRVKAVMAGSDRASQIAWKATAAALAYTSRRIPEIADDIVNVDNAMKWGYGWELGPFETWDALGVAATIERMEKDGYQPAAWVKEMVASRPGFYGGAVSTPTYFDLGAKADVPVPSSEKAISLAALRPTNEVLKNDGASLIDLGDGVACLEFHTKMNALDGDVIGMIDQAVARVERDFAGLVVGNQAVDAFSAGANIFMILVAAGNKDWKTIEMATKALQDSLMRLRYSDFPVVTAPFGLTLGGGVEVAMHGDATRAYAELYMGLVEVGVGLIPAGGGCKEMVCRALGNVPDGVDPFSLLQQVFMTIAMAKVSMSAEEARGYGFLRESDGVTVVSAQSVVVGDSPGNQVVQF